MKEFDIQLRNARELATEEMKKVLGGQMEEGQLCPSDKPYAIHCDNGRARLICCRHNDKEMCCKAANGSATIEHSIQ